MRIAPRAMYLWAIVIGVILFELALFVSVFYLEKYVHDPKSRELMHYFVQILTGNWSRPAWETYSKRPFILSTSITLALTLNLLSLGLITLLVWSANKLRREHAVKVRDLNVVRDEAIVTAFEVLLRETNLSTEQRQQMEDLLNLAIERGDTAWAEKYMPKVLQRSKKRIREEYDGLEI